MLQSYYSTMSYTYLDSRDDQTNYPLLTSFDIPWKTSRREEVDLLSPNFYETGNDPVYQY
jgi:hypothetical protein